MNAMRCRSLLAGILIASAVLAWARKEETLEQLQARVEHALPEERPGIYSEIARRYVAAADQAYTDGKVDAARQDLDNAVNSAEKARDSAVSINKKLKNIEIDVRKMASRLREIKRTVNFEDQPVVQTAIDHMERIRTDLLSKMFGAKDGK